MVIKNEQDCLPVLLVFFCEFKILHFWVCEGMG